MQRTLPLIVPLGCNCFPRWCATVLRFKKRKREGELTFPLDAAGVPFPMVRFLAESDFAGMADPANLLLRRAPSGERVLCDRRFPSSTYAHEIEPATDLDFVGDNARRFVERYARRIDDLRSALARADRVVLFMTVTNLLGPTDNPVSYEGFDAIIRAFEERYPHASFRLLVIIERFQQEIPDSWDGRIRVFNFQLPGPYTKFIAHYLMAVAAGNILGSVVHSFPDSPSLAPPRLPEPHVAIDLVANVLGAAYYTSPMRDLLAPIMTPIVNRTPLGAFLGPVRNLFPENRV